MPRHTTSGGGGGGGQTLYDAVVASSDGDYTTLKAAIDDGATSIFVRDGTYTETGAITVSPGSSNITIIGESRDGTIIDFGANAYNLIFNGDSGNQVSNVYIANLTIKNGDYAATSGAIRFEYTNDAVVENVQILRSSAPTNYTAGLFIAHSQRITVSKSLFYDTSNSNNYLGIWSRENTVDRINISNNIFQSGGSDRAIFVQDVSNESTTINGNVINGWDYGIYLNGDDISVTGNVIADCGTTGIHCHTNGHFFAITGNELLRCAIGIRTGGVYACTGNVINQGGNNYIGIKAGDSSGTISGNMIYNTGSAAGISVEANKNLISGNFIRDAADGIKVLSNIDETAIVGNYTWSCSGYGVNVSASTCDDTFVHGNYSNSDTSGGVNDAGTTTTSSDNVAV